MTVLVSLLLVTDHDRDQAGVDPAPLGPAVAASGRPSTGGSAAASVTPVVPRPESVAVPADTAVAARPGPAEAAQAKRGRSGPLFRPAAEPAVAGAVTPEVAHLRLGDADQPAAGVQVRAGMPRGLPIAAGAGGLRGDRETRTLGLRQADTHVFSAVGVTWTGDPAARVSVAVRSRVPGQGWTGWRAVGAATADRDPDDRPADEPAHQPTDRAARDPVAADRQEAAPAWRQGADLLWLGAADAIEVQVSASRKAGLADFAVDLIDPRSAPGDAAAGRPATGATPGSGAVPMPPIARRADWGADERLMDWTPGYGRPVQAVVLHHTATATDYQPADVPRMLRTIYYFQAVSRGWGDIGYPVLVDRFGRLWEGRYGGLARPVVGAHASGFNRVATGIALLGDFDRTAVPPAAVDAIGRYAGWKLSLAPTAVHPWSSVKVTSEGGTSRFRAGTAVTLPRVLPHRQTSDTGSPGDRGVAALGAIRDAARKYMGDRTEPSTMRPRLGVWRPSDATWRVRGSADPVLHGWVGDLPVAADFDGDGSGDPGTWTASTGRWRIANSGGGTLEQYTLGRPGDRPIPADYNGDGRAEPAVWRESDGTWWLGVGPPTQWGVAGDVPVPGDYDGDGRADIAVYRPGEGMWHIRGGRTIRLGEANFLPLPADYDGDGTTDPAAWSPVTGRWFLPGRVPSKYGEPGDTPVPAQYDGDGRADTAVWRNGDWNIRKHGSVTFGQPGDVPIVLA
ncbi:hypothetical protein Vau01_005460 [Virgisporangium aurantiacum]|uniref:Peptidoglycan recognition protein family domain-containing protein n=2 Tax=Virgisporangium aurantiacum TaxID=175570 RepID=A0A8J3Z0L2_9ACTN|nr:hypothetical protein Vau01_005460 [Virgisporangium aurantiacum]